MLEGEFLYYDSYAFITFSHAFAAKRCLSVGVNHIIDHTEVSVAIGKYSSKDYDKFLKHEEIEKLKETEESSGKKRKKEKFSLKEVREAMRENDEPLPKKLTNAEMRGVKLDEEEPQPKRGKRRIAFGAAFKVVQNQLQGRNRNRDPKSQSTRKPVQSAYKISIKNLPKDCSKSEIENVFSEFGNIESIFISKPLENVKNEKYREIATVIFSRIETIFSIMDGPSFEIRGKQLDIRIKNAEHQKMFLQYQQAHAEKVVEVSDCEVASLPSSLCDSASEVSLPESRNGVPLFAYESVEEMTDEEEIEKLGSEIGSCKSDFKNLESIETTSSNYKVQQFIFHCSSPKK